MGATALGYSRRLQTLVRGLHSNRQGLGHGETRQVNAVPRKVHRLYEGQRVWRLSHLLSSSTTGFLGIDRTTDKMLHRETA
jgi:hypothetical protein